MKVRSASHDTQALAFAVETRQRSLAKEGGFAA